MSRLTAVCLSVCLCLSVWRNLSSSSWALNLFFPVTGMFLGMMPCIWVILTCTHKADSTLEQLLTRQLSHHGCHGNSLTHRYKHTVSLSHAHTLTCMAALLAVRSPTLALGSTCRLSMLSRLMNAIALCRVTCFLRRVSMASRHCSTMMMSSLGAPETETQCLNTVTLAVVKQPPPFLTTFPWPWWKM